jgi:hypothetical protein
MERDDVLSAIDIDPKTLEVVAAASAHAYEQAIVHINEEIKARDPANLSALIGSLAAEGPYAYTILAQVDADGSVTVPVMTTRDQIAAAYAVIRGMSDLHKVVGLTEVRGAWYLFQDAMTLGSSKGSDEVNTRRTLGLFPSGTGAGITGELVWVRVPRSQLGAPDDVEIVAEDDTHARLQVFEQYERYLDAMRANDMDLVLETVHDGVASAVRDYVDDTGTLVELSGKDAHRAWYQRFFDKLEVRSVEALCQVTEDWYVFAELRIEAALRESGGTVVFNTAEFHVPAKDGRFIARIGHGTEPARGE